VAERFIVSGLGQAVDRSQGAKPHLNLPDAALMQLVDAGLAARHIDVTDRCTHRDGDEFFSHRRDEGTTGRLAAVIAI
jgi:copper oxidase (laccase) domain-containing protein